MSAEDNIKRGCVKILKKALIEYTPHLWYYCPTDRFMIGIPDILICYKGRWMASELKAPNGKVSKIQQHTLAQLQAAGAVVSICRTTAEFSQELMIFMMRNN